MMVCIGWIHLLYIFGDRASLSPQAKIKVKNYSNGPNGQKLVFLNVRLIYFLVFEYAVY